MHKCLLVAEILQNVLERIRLEGIVGRNPTLVALATTCRAFSEPALDQLYYALPSIRPIIRCLPQDVRQLRGPSESTKPLEQHHWDTIARYSRRVRSLQLLFNSEDLAAYTVLSSPPDPSYLFPFLRVLRWRCGSDDPTDVERMIPFLKFTLRPSLYEISLTLSSVALETHVDLHTLGIHCPNLQLLDIVFTSASPFMDQLICSCRNLRRLGPVQLSKKLFHFIATSSFLDSLSLILDYVEPDALQLWAGQCNFPIFSSLRILSLQANSARAIVAFFQVKLWPIRRMFITLVHSTFDAGTRELLFSLLHDQCDHDLLEGITVSADSVHREDAPVVDVQTFLPLMAFSNLTQVTLLSVMALGIDDNALERLALAWPRLQSITIAQQLGTYVCPNITLRGLALLLKHCPDLSSVKISLNAQIIPTEDCLPRNDHIRFVDVNYSPITDPEGVAAFLSCMMPSLRMIMWSFFRMPVGISTSSSNEWREKWNVVSAQLGGSG